MKASAKYLVDTLGPFFAKKKGTNILYGNQIPGTDSTYDIGSSVNYWAHGYFDTVFSGDADLSAVAGRTVVAGVGLVSDEVALEDGSPTISMGTPSQVGAGTGNEATNDPDTHTHAVDHTDDADTDPEKLLSSDSLGKLILRYLDVVASMNTSLIYSYDSTSEDLELSPTGSLILDPDGNLVAPEDPVEVVIGSYLNKYLYMSSAYAHHGMITPHGVQSVIPGALRMSAVTTYITRDAEASDTTLYFADNTLADGDFVAVLFIDESDPVASVREIIGIDSAGTLETAGDYSYTVTRDLSEEMVVAGENPSNNSFDSFMGGFMPQATQDPFTPVALVGGSSSTVIYAGEGVFVLGRDADTGFIEWAQDMMDGHEGPGISAYRRTATTTYESFKRMFYTGQINGLADYAAAGIGTGIGNDLSLDPDDASDGYIGMWSDKSAFRINNPTLRVFVGGVEKGYWGPDGVVKLGSDISSSSTTAFHFDGTNVNFTGDGGIGRLNVASVQPVTIADGAIDISSYDHNSVFEVRGEGSADDVLEEITGFNVGDILIFGAFNHATYGKITILNTSHFYLQDQAVLDGSNKVIVFFAATSSLLVPISATHLSEIYDVEFTSLADGDVLSYNSTSGMWVNSVSAGGAEELDELSDVVLDTPADNEVLVYDTTTSKWINQTAAEAGLSTVDEINDLSDVVITTPADHDKLYYDSASGDWLNSDAIQGFLKLSGDNATISAGAITVTGSRCAVTSESGSADNLDTINPADGENRILCIMAASGHTITVRHAADNIRLAGGGNVVLSGLNAHLWLWKRYAGGDWLEFTYDHAIYALLAGRSGGQTLIGGTAIGDRLTLKANSVATASSTRVTLTSINDTAQNILPAGSVREHAHIRGILRLTGSSAGGDSEYVDEWLLVEAGGGSGQTTTITHTTGHVWTITLQEYSGGTGVLRIARTTGSTYTGDAVFWVDYW